MGSNGNGKRREVVVSLDLGKVADSITGMVARFRRVKPVTTVEEPVARQTPEYPSSSDEYWKSDEDDDELVLLDLPEPQLLREINYPAPEDAVLGDRRADRDIPEEKSIDNDEPEWLDDLFSEDDSDEEILVQDDGSDWLSGLGSEEATKTLTPPPFSFLQVDEPKIDESKEPIKETAPVNFVQQPLSQPAYKVERLQAPAYAPRLQPKPESENQSWWKSLLARIGWKTSIAIFVFALCPLMSQNPSGFVFIALSVGLLIGGSWARKGKTNVEQKAGDKDAAFRKPDDKVKVSPTKSKYWVGKNVRIALFLAFLVFVSTICAFMADNASRQQQAFLNGQQTPQATVCPLDTVTCNALATAQANR